MAKHTGTPQITVSDQSIYSAECSRYGDGQCDGYVNDPTGEFEGAVCACGCHSALTDCPMDSLGSVAAWHAEQWRLFG